MEYIKNGLYNIKDKYFEDFKSAFFSHNKNESRPHYFLFKDSDGVFWFIPLSTQVKSYSDKIKRDTKKYRKCIFYHIGKIAGVDRVFLIGNMFPVTDIYIKKPFTISKIHYIVKNKRLVKEVNKKANEYLALVKYNKIVPKINILQIKDELMNNKK